ncbi:16S rRNA (cytosine(1402)-N(4))-methyltransferase RsmH [soil metagenome]
MQVKYHEPVLRDASVNGLDIHPDGTYVDVTFGGGGHSRAILAQMSKGKLIAFDQDADAVQNVPDDVRFNLVQDNFRHLEFQLNNQQVIPVDGILADLGVSSHQFDEASRGFSIRFDADLDMRMDQQASLTARDVLNHYSEHDLMRVFKEYGEINNARKVASLVAASRKINPIRTIDEFKKVINPCAPRGKENSFYAQIFQALRIEVNDELGALKDLLEQAPSVLRQGGRLVVISYHSLEDRLVKNFINTGNTAGELKKDFYGNVTGLLFKALTRKPVEADASEVERNPRSRSAKMRIAEKL